MFLLFRYRTVRAILELDIWNWIFRELVSFLESLWILLRDEKIKVESSRVEKFQIFKEDEKEEVG